MHLRANCKLFRRQRHAKLVFPISFTTAGLNANFTVVTVVDASGSRLPQQVQALYQRQWSYRGGTTDLDGEVVKQFRVSKPMCARVTMETRRGLYQLSAVPTRPSGTRPTVGVS
jgi:hypothetical protein